MDQLTFEDKLKREGFTQVENCIIRSPKISPIAKTLYFQLCSYAWDGTGFPGRETLARQNDMHVNTIDKYIKELKDSKLITVKRRGVNKTNLYTIKSIGPTLHNWLEPIHRLESHADVSHIVSESHADVSQESHASVKEEYSVEKDSVKDYVVQQAESTASSTSSKHKEILDYLLEKSGRKFMHKAEKNKKPLNGRLSEGYEVADFKKVIDWKVHEWTGTQFESYLRPETLFGNKFEGYLNDANSNLHRVPQDYTPTITPLQPTKPTQQEDEEGCNFIL